MTPISRSWNRWLHLGRIAAQPLDVGIQSIDLDHLHPALDTPQEGGVLVAVEVVAGGAAQDGGDPGDKLVHVVREGRRHGGALAADDVGDIGGDLGGNAIGSQAHVGDARGADRLGRRLQVLVVAFGDGKAAELLGGRHAGGAFAAQPEQNHHHSGLFEGLGDRNQQAVHPPVVRRHRGRTDRVLLDHGQMVLVDDIDMVRQEGFAVTPCWTPASRWRPRCVRPAPRRRTRCRGPWSR